MEGRPFDSQPALSDRQQEIELYAVEVLEGVRALVDAALRGERAAPRSAVVALYDVSLDVWIGYWLADGCAANWEAA